MFLLCCVGEGNWRVSEAVKVSQRYHVIDGLEPGTMYTVRLMAKRLLDKASIFEDVIQTRVKGERYHYRFPSSSPGVPLSVILVLLLPCLLSFATLSCLVICVVKSLV